MSAILSHNFVILLYRVKLSRTACVTVVANRIGEHQLAMVYQRSGAGNRHFCNLLARIEDHINMILNLFFTGNAIQSCYGRLKSTGGRSKNGIFRVYTVKNDRNRHDDDDDRLTAFDPGQPG